MIDKEAALGGLTASWTYDAVYNVLRDKAGPKLDDTRDGRMARGEEAENVPLLHHAGRRWSPGATSKDLLSMFFGRKYSWRVWLTLIPIVGGVAVGSTTEINFSMAAFLCAMTSNVTSALRAATSKDLQADTGLKGINLYGGIAIVSGIMLLPLSLLVEGSQMGAAFAAAPALMTAKGTLLFGIWNAGFMAYLIIGSMFYHLYNQTAYQALGELTPLSHSVANTVKRVVIILASVAVFKNPITPLGQVSAAIAILGTFIYSVVVQQDKEKAAKAAAAAKAD